MASAALSQFKQTLRAVQALLSLERKFHDPPRPADLPAVQGLRGGAAVLMVAGLEQFLREFFPEATSRLTRGARIDFGKLPSELQVQSVYGTLELAMSGPQYQPKNDKIDRLPDIYLASSRVFAMDVNPVVFGETGSNPNSKTLRQIANALGIKDIWDEVRTEFALRWAAPIHRRFAEETLDIIINRRHVVAHTANATQISRRDLIDSIRFLRILTECIEKSVKVHLRHVKRVAR